MNYTLSKIDQDRFGYISAKAYIDDGENAVEALIEWSRHNSVEFLIVRVPVNQLNAVQRLEEVGAFLTDTLVYYQKQKIEFYADSLPEGYKMRLAAPEDARRLEALALETFHDYSGHYHADARLKKEDCDQVYASWAANSCKEQKVADAVILLEQDDEIAAFATQKILSKENFDGILFGVAPAHRGKNLHLSLMKESQNWGLRNGYTRMITSTQITNLAVQKNWCRLGFEPEKSYYTFHKWFI